MKMFMYLTRPLAVVVLFCLISTGSHALPMPEINKDPDHTLYGTLSQNDPLFETMYQNGTLFANAGCGPVSAVNSFVYLEKKYPEVYVLPNNEHLLVQSSDPKGRWPTVDLVNVAETLAGAPYMNTTLAGTWSDMMIYGKSKYIDAQMAGMTGYKTGYKAMMTGTWGSPPVTLPPKPNWVQDNMYPTWQFIYSELRDCEDVEILVNWGTSGGHYVTLTGMTWDTDGEGTITCVDPMDGGPVTYKIKLVDGHLKTNSRAQPNNYTRDITMAVSESPAPEPMTIILIGAGLVGLLGIARRRMR